MRVLLTNHGLKQRAGTELYVRDIALALQRRGVEPWCYAPELGEVAEEIRAAGVLVADRLEDLPGRPDVIHGHHRLETTAAGVFFSDVPILSYCHGSKPWQERPCRLPSVARWVAVDEACRERLIVEEGIDPQRIELLLNFVDTTRFPQRGPLPSQPRRALVFSNNASQETHLQVLREVCGTAGIELDVVGTASGKVVDNPGALLPQYDLVFAKARAAIEAMAVGCAVVQCDYAGAGRMVTPANFDELRVLNFGFKSLCFPLAAEHLLGEVRAYDATASRVVSDRVRSECSLEPAVDRLIVLYEEAVQGTRVGEPGATLRSAGLFLESEIAYATAGRAAVDARREVARLRGVLERTRAERQAAKEALAEAKARLAELKSRRSWWRRLWGRR